MTSRPRKKVRVTVQGPRLSDEQVRGFFGAIADKWAEDITREREEADAKEQAEKGRESA